MNSKNRFIYFIYVFHLLIFSFLKSENKYGLFMLFHPQLFRLL